MFREISESCYCACEDDDDDDDDDDANDAKDAKHDNDNEFSCSGVYLNLMNIQFVNEIPWFV